MNDINVVLAIYYHSINQYFVLGEKELEAFGKLPPLERIGIKRFQPPSPEPQPSSSKTKNPGDVTNRSGTGKKKKSPGHPGKPLRGRVSKKNTLSFKWKRCQFEKLVKLPQQNWPNCNDECRSPMHFLQFFTDELVSMICDQSNLYRNQETKICTNITSRDIWEFVVQLSMGVTKMPDFRDYWSLKTDVM